LLIVRPSRRQLLVQWHGHGAPGELHDQAEGEETQLDQACAGEKRRGRRTVSDWEEGVCRWVRRGEVGGKREPGRAKGEETVGPGLRGREKGKSREGWGGEKGGERAGRGPRVGRSMRVEEQGRERQRGGGTVG
jgi:hypothetical protein